MTEPIEAYGLISDCQGSALVSQAGSIDWACLPRFDAPAVFARLLDPSAGHWSLRPAIPAAVERAYLEETMVLRTVFTTAAGAVAVTDAMPFDPDERGHGVGRRAPHAVVRVVEGLTGAVEVDMEVAPRPEYGVTVPRLLAQPGGARTRGGPLACVISSETPLDLGSGSARSRFTLRAGERRRFALQVCSPWAPAPPAWDPAEVDRRLEATVAGWRSWSAIHQSYQGAFRDLVHHSGRVLQALTYAPTGAVVAAATTSLPETPGGTRNWDYRYCWVRDASLTLEALWVAACPDEARDFFDFFATAAGGEVDGRSALQILYGVGGERDVAERELAHLAGYRQSRPVRVGNGAWNQTQLDVYGELLSAACRLADQVGDFDEVTAAFLAEVADTAAARWEEPDQGIWEVRGGPRHFLYSKLMCWVALDRAIRLAPRLRAEDRVAAWRVERDRIRRAILDQGWSDQAGAYTQAFGHDDLDASTLMMPIVGFLPPGEPRMRATIEAVATRLTDSDGLVYRYRADDGLPGEEGTFAICSFWLVQCWALLGDLTRACHLFETVATRANDLGLFAEEIGPGGEALGNFPQAFTHVGLVNAAWAIDQAKERLTGRWRATE